MVLTIDREAYRTSSSGFPKNEIFADTYLVKTQQNSVFKFFTKDLSNQAEGLPVDRVKVFKTGKLALTEKGEGAITSISKRTGASVSLTFKKYALAVSDTFEAGTDGYPIIQNELLNQIAMASIDNMDNVIISQIGTDIGSLSSQVKRPNGKTSSNMAVSDTFDLDYLFELLAYQAEEANGENYKIQVAVLHTQVLKYFRKELLDSGDKLIFSPNINKFIESNDISGNYVGRFSGIEFFTSDKIQSATENSIKVYKNILIGENKGVGMRTPIAYANKWRPIFRTEDSNAQAEFTISAYVERYGVKVVEPKGILMAISS